jgi:hypothetical protein
VDAERWLGRVREEGLVSAAGLEPLSHEDVPDHLAAIGRGTAEDGTPLVVAVAPRSAGDALLAGLATGLRLAAEDAFTGQLVVVAPSWSLAARRRLGLVRAELPFALRTVEAPALAERPPAVEAEAALDPGILTVAQVAGRVVDPAQRDLFARAASALGGLAVKHGGTLRGTAESVELVVLAQRVAELRAEDGAVVLVTLQPQRSAASLETGGLASALDALEGQIRRRLNDRKVRDGEDGLRARALPALSEACGLRDGVAWPLGGADREDVDLVAVDEAGRPVIAAVRETMTLSGVGGVLDALQSLRLGLPTVLAGAAPPVLLGEVRLVLAAEAFASGAVRALGAIALAHDLLEIRSQSERDVTLASIGAEEAMRSLRDRPRRRRGRGRSGAGADDARPERAEEAAGSDAEEEREERSDSARAGERDRDEEGGGRGRGRRRGRRRGRGRAGADEAEETSGAAEPESEPADRPRFEELSLLDLDDGGDDGGDEGGGRRRRGRGGRRRRRGGREGAAAARGDSTDGQVEGGGATRSGGRGSASASEDEDDEEGFADDDFVETLSELPDELEVEPEVARPAPVAEDDEDDEDEEEAEAVAARPARSGGRRAPAAAVEPEPPRPPRRRAVIVARADRDSLTAAVILARDVRLLEGLWVYPQNELMGFFREVAVDLRDDVPIHVVGFAPSPAIDVLQAASLYRDRIFWYDHHEWAPEDDAALKQALGQELVHHTPGAGSSLPAVLETCTRRSRFSDKLVDLATGRFTQHDYERWGRLWWWRLGQVAERRGEVRAEVSALLTGRPSDLAKEAARVDTPPVPDEVAFVSSRDFRLVHFVGYGMVVVDVEGDFDLHLVGRIARERYGAQLSLVRRAGTEHFVFAGDEVAGRRVLDFAGLVDHLANKLDWVVALSNDDHVARFRILGLAEHPNRLDEVIGEIAMGRSILER